MKKPRPHQQAAIADITKCLSQSDRCKLISACGTGKTLTSLWVAKRMGYTQLLVALPSLLLQSQALDAWIQDAADAGDYSILIVGSDRSIDGLVTTDPVVIGNFLGNEGPKIVFTTYHSQGALSLACNTMKYQFDMLICDEAHRTTGSEGRYFSLLTDDSMISCRKRLFITATEKFFEGDRVLSMDDVTIYGETAHFLSTKEAIEKGILCEYRILVTYVAEDSSAPNGDQVIYNALIKAIRKYNLKKIITYHSSIVRAQYWQTLLSTEQDVTSLHINHQDKSKERQIILDKIRKEKGVVAITNVRALTEGFDLPEADCVAIIDPKGGIADTIQQIGRVLRLSPGKKMGYIFLPILISKKGIASEYSAIRVRQALAAMASADGRIIDYYSSPKKLGRGKGRVIVEDYINISTDVVNQGIRPIVWRDVSALALMSYAEVKRWVADNLKPINNSTKWKRWVNGEYPLLPKRPLSMPHNPPWAYRSEWDGWVSFFEIEKKNYTETQQWLRDNRPDITTSILWHKHCSEFPDFIYRHPDRTFKEFRGWLHFLGRHVEHPPYDEARHIASSVLRIPKSQAYALLVKQGGDLMGLPKNPDKHYKGKGWKGWGHFLGKE